MEGSMGGKLCNIRLEHYIPSVKSAYANLCYCSIFDTLYYLLFCSPFIFFLECTFLLYTIVLYSTSDVTDVENMAYPTTATSISTSFSHSLKWHTSQQKVTYIYFQNLVILSSDIHSTKITLFSTINGGPWHVTKIF